MLKHKTTLTSNPPYPIHLGYFVFVFLFNSTSPVLSLCSCEIFVQQWKGTIVDGCQPSKSFKTKRSNQNLPSNYLEIGCCAFSISFVQIRNCHVWKCAHSRGTLSLHYLSLLPPPPPPLLRSSSFSSSVSLFSLADSRTAVLLVRP